MSDNQKLDKYIERRLQTWADWFMRDLHGLGYSRESSIMMFQKGIKFGKDKAYNLLVLQTNESAEEIEKLVVEMSGQNLKMADALRKYYLGREPILRLKAKALGISEAQFKILLGMARQWLAGRLSAK